jgi:hypothetical protein
MRRRIRARHTYFSAAASARGAALAAGPARAPAVTPPPP